MKQDITKWLSLATGKDAHYEWLLKPFNLNGLTFAVDMFRFHIATGEHADAPCPQNRADNVMSVLNGFRQFEIAGTFSRWHLERALMACKPFAHEGSNIFRMSANGSLVCSSANEQYGDCTVTIAHGDEWTVGPIGKRKRVSPVIFTHDGTNCLIAVNHKYLADALKGMSDVVEYRMRPMDGGRIACGLYLRGERDNITREVCIMAMQDKEA